MNTPPISKAGALAIVGGLLVLALAVQTWQLVSAQRENTALRLHPLRETTVVAKLRVDTVRVLLAAAERAVTPALARVRVDTLVLRPETARDTATALVQFPALAAAHDSLQRSCGALVLTCRDYRSAAEKRFAADSVYARSLEAALKGAQPSRLGAIWGRVKMPLAFGLGVYVGAQVTQ